MKPLFRLMIVFLVLAQRVAAGADNRVLADSYLPADFSVSALSAIGDTGDRAIGFADTLPVIVRYSSDGRLLFTRYPQTNNGPQAFTLVSMPDGGFISVDLEANDLGFEQTCPLRRFDASGRLLWSNYVAQTYLCKTKVSVAPRLTWTARAPSGCCLRAHTGTIYPSSTATAPCATGFP